MIPDSQRGQLRIGHNEEACLISQTQHMAELRFELEPVWTPGPPASLPPLEAPNKDPGMKDDHPRLHGILSLSLEPTKVLMATVWPAFFPL